MRNKLVLDTSFISSLLIKEDVNHKKAVSIYENFPGDSIFYVPSTVIIELFVGFKKIGNEWVSNLKDFFDSFEYEVVYINKSYLESFKEFLLQGDNLNLKTMDYTILFSAKIAKGDIVTFDKKLDKLATI